MNLNKVVKSILKSAVYIMDETADRVDRVSSRASRFADDTRRVIYPHESHVARNMASFAAGVGVGVAVGVLLAPSSGRELRHTISDRVQNIGDRVRSRAEPYATGTEVR